LIWADGLGDHLFVGEGLGAHQIERGRAHDRGVVTPVVALPQGTERPGDRLGQHRRLLGAALSSGRGEGTPRRVEAFVARADEAGKRVVLVLCGGNIDTRLLANVLLRDLARSGRLARLQITLQDRPGALFKVMKLFNDHNVNIIEIYHQRIFTTLPAKGLITDIECEARDADQLQRLIDDLKRSGYKVERVELN